METINPENCSILFYDGECGFCNKSVQFVLSNEKNDSIYFSALQNEFATVFLQDKLGHPIDYSTIYYWHKGKLSKRSTAIMRLAKEIKYPAALIRIFVIVPTFIRDAIYKLIAKYRKKISKNFCVIPSSHQAKRFLK